MYRFCARRFSNLNILFKFMSPDAWYSKLCHYHVEHFWLKLPCSNFQSHTFIKILFFLNVWLTQAFLCCLCKNKNTFVNCLTFFCTRRHCDLSILYNLCLLSWRLVPQDVEHFWLKLPCTPFQSHTFIKMLLFPNVWLTQIFLSAYHWSLLCCP